MKMQEIQRVYQIPLDFSAKELLIGTLERKGYRLSQHWEESDNYAIYEKDAIGQQYVGTLCSLLVAVNDPTNVGKNLNKLLAEWKP